MIDAVSPWSTVWRQKTAHFEITIQSWRGNRGDMPPWYQWKVVAFNGYFTDSDRCESVRAGAEAALQSVTRFLDSLRGDVARETENAAGACDRWSDQPVAAE